MQALHNSITETGGEPEWEVARLFPMRGDWSEEDYFSLPDNRGVELANGCLEFLPMPTEAHQIILAFVYEALAGFVRRQHIGLVLFAGIAVRVRDGKIRQPDIVFMHRDNASRRTNQCWEGADLAMEIISPAPTDRKRDEVTKRDEYAKAGIREYWIIDPDAREIKVHILEGASYRVLGAFSPGTNACSQVVSGFSIAVDEVFSAPAEWSGRE